MRIFHGFESLPAFRSPAVTVGSYDGIHRGHMRLLESLLAEAKTEGGESVVLTFEPHPRITLGRAEGLRLLTTLEEKCVLLERMGIDHVIVIPFDEAFSRVTPYEFIQNYLISKVGARTMIAGYDHHFGRDNEGNYSFLNRQGFPLRIVEVAECNVDSEKVSSTVIRRLIARGEMRQAVKLLGHPYPVIGEAKNGVVKTAPLKLLPAPGTYEILIGGQPATARIDPSGTLTANHLPDGKVSITF